MTAKILIEKLMEHYNINTISELAEILKIGQPAISKWKINNSITPIRKKCKEIGIYDKIFLDNTNKILPQKDTDTISQNSNELSKYFKALESVAIATNNKDELITDIKNLMHKYINSNETFTEEYNSQLNLHQDTTYTHIKNQETIDMENGYKERKGNSTGEEVLNKIVKQYEDRVSQGLNKDNLELIGFRKERFKVR